MPNRPIINVIKNRDFLTSTPEKSVRAVALHMKQLNTAAVLVVDPEDGTLVGICTERDLVFKVMAEGLDPLTTPVQAVMTHNPHVITPEKSFGHALHLMFEGGYRHLPVIDPNGRPIGVVSSRDALGIEIIRFRSEIERREELAELL
jgi:CBS domain-containing protein